MGTIRTYVPNVSTLKISLRRGSRAAVYLSGPSDAAVIFRSRIGTQHVEVLGILLVDTRQHVIAYYEVSRGTIDSVNAKARDILVAALLTNAAAVIVAHNHPSGYVSPSAEDVSAARAIAAAGRLLSVPVIDFMIIGSGREYFSFSEKGVTL